MIEQKSLKEFWNSGIAQFPQKGGAIKQAIGVFEVPFTTEETEKRKLLAVWLLRA